MPDNNIIEKIKQFLKISPEYSGRIQDDISNDYHLIETGILDSFGIILLVAFLEETFGIRVDGEDLIPENFETMISIEKYVKSKKYNSK